MNLREKLKEGRFVVTVELNPPKGTDLSALEKSAALLKDKVDAANVTDGTGALMKASPVPVAYRIQQQGIEPILQLTCRDRNKIAVQSELLGAACLGVRNMLALGLNACINSDDPAYFGGYMNENFNALIDAVGLTREEIFQLTINGFESSFLAQPEKQTHLDRINAMR